MAAESSVLFIVENFRQGWGGGPESVRLMARRLARFGVSSDVVDRGKLHKAIEAMDVLPVDQSLAEQFVTARIRRYHALFQIGPWQNPWRAWTLLRERSSHAPHFYLPRGGLAEVEFVGKRGLKKYPYFSMIESRFLESCDRIIYSSEAERRSTSIRYRDNGRSIVIPDYFEPGEIATRKREAPTVLRLGFLAEIAPRKGLLEFIRALALWAPQRAERGWKIQLRIGGGVRPGSERYLAQVREISDAIPSVEIDYLGPISHADRSAFYAETDVFLLPSTFESFGLTALEAMSAGCVLLCSPYVGALEYVQHSPGVVVLDDLSVSSIEKGLDRAVHAVDRAGDAPSYMDAAAQVVSAINAIADERWAQLLHSSLAGARAP